MERDHEQGIEGQLKHLGSLRSRHYRPEAVRYYLHRAFDTVELDIRPPVYAYLIAIALVIGAVLCGICLDTTIVVKTPITLSRIDNHRYAGSVAPIIEKLALARGNAVVKLASGAGSAAVPVAFSSAHRDVGPASQSSGRSVDQGGGPTAIVTLGEPFSAPRYDGAELQIPDLTLAKVLSVVFGRNR